MCKTWQKEKDASQTTAYDDISHCCLSRGENMEYVHSLMEILTLCQKTVPHCSFFDLCDVMSTVSGIYAAMQQRPLIAEKYMVRCYSWNNEHLFTTVTFK